MHDQVLTSRDKRLEPSPIVFSDHMKGGVDVVDLIAKMSTRIKNKRWVINSLAFVLDTARTNAKTIYMDNTKEKLSTFSFTWELFLLCFLFCPETMKTHAESINSDLQRGLDRRLRHTHTTLNTEQNQLAIKASADN